MTERTPAEVLANAERAAVRLIAGAEGMSWEWDSRFSAVLTVVKAPNDGAALALVGGVFPGGWDHESIKSAQDPIRKIASAWGGLNKGQRLFALDPANDPLLFAAWWPWGGGTTFSLRVGCAARAAEDPAPQLRRWFSL